MDTLPEAWAQLVSTHESESDPTEIKKNKFIIGRSTDADLSLTGNKFISGRHCFIERSNNGDVWLHDISTNGTLLNGNQKLSKTKALLKHGDEFHIVYQKENPSVNVSYLFQDKDALLREELNSLSEQTVDYDVEDPDKTIEMNELSDPQVDSDIGKKRKAEINSYEQDECVKSVKLQKTETSDLHPETIDDADKCESDKQLNTMYDTAAFEQSLTCIICQEIYHDCISCQPCMHCFCAGCYSDWMTKSNDCPSCRQMVERVNKNYVINDLVETYLKQHPEKKRPDSELEALDSRSKIMKDSVKVLKPEKTLSDIIDEDDDDNNLSTSSIDEDSDMSANQLNFGAPLQRDTVFGLPKVICRQCPEYKVSVAGCQPNVTTFTTSQIAGPSTSKMDDKEKSISVAAGYRCKPDQIHIMCQCCLTAMPDRRTESQKDNSIPLQQCTFCYRIYCNLYWGCQAARCDGCIARFKDLHFGPKCLRGLILQNEYESDIFKNYLMEKSLDINDVIKVCLHKLDDGSYTSMDQARGLNSNTVICYECGLRNLRDLAYQYRKDIPNSELPESVTKRPECYWGKNCRTQRGKIAHAARYNHICEQTKTS